MSAADTMDFGILEVATPTTTEPVASETTVSEVQPSEQPTETTEVPEELQTPEQKEAAAAKEPITNKAIREALKTFKAADPANAKIASALNNALGRQEAYERLFPSAKEATEFKTFVDNMGGREGIQGMYDMVESVKQTDQLLYTGDGPQLLQNIVEDLKSEGKLDSLGKIAPSFLDAVQEHDPKGYARAFAPHFAQGLEKAGVRDALNGLVNAFDTDNKANMKAGLTQFVQWYNGIMKSAEAKPSVEVDPEREAFQKEKNEFETSKSKAFQTEVVSHTRTGTNAAIVKAMLPMLQKPFFKGFPKETVQVLGKDVRSATNTFLQNDKDTQAQLKVLWKTNDKAKIANYFNGRVAEVAPGIAEKMIRSRYPGYAKTPAKGTTTTTTAAKPGQRFSNVTPIMVGAKPAWESVDWTKDPSQVMWITGKAFLKNGKFITWKK